MEYYFIISRYYFSHIYSVLNWNHDTFYWFYIILHQKTKKSQLENLQWPQLFYHISVYVAWTLNGTQSMKAQHCMKLISKLVPWPVRMINPVNTFDGMDWTIKIFKKITAIALYLVLTINRNWHTALRKVLFINLIIIMNITIAI